MNHSVAIKPLAYDVRLSGAGGKGGGNARTPVETPDSLHSMAVARIIDLVSEGEIRGLVAGNQSVHLNQVPIQNPDGGLNFAGVSVDTRSGTQDQDYIPGLPSVENEISVNVELRSDQPVVRTVRGSDLSAVRIRLAVPALQEVDSENADRKGYSISYAVDLSVDRGAYSTVLNDAITGKTTTQYEPQPPHRSAGRVPVADPDSAADPEPEQLPDLGRRKRALDDRDHRRQTTLPDRRLTRSRSNRASRWASPMHRSAC